MALSSTTYEHDFWDNIDIDPCIDKYFPFDSYREGQREAIHKIVKAFADGYRFVICEAPTGSGKSAIGYSIMQFFQSSYWLTIQKSLQDQLMREFGVDQYGQFGKFISENSPHLIDLKGRNAYRCTYNEVFNYASADMSADKGECKKKGVARFRACMQPPEMQAIESCPDIKFNKYSICPYWERKIRATGSDHCLMNFSSFLYQTSVVEDFIPRQLMIIDEAHNIESELMRFIELRLIDKPFRKFGIEFPELNTPEEYASYFRQIKLQNLIVEEIQRAMASQDPDSENEWKNCLLKFKNFMNSADSGNWIIEFQPRRLSNNDIMYIAVIIKPILVDEYASQHIFNMSQRVLMMSATILSPQIMCQGLGIDSDEVYKFRMSNKFPVDNRKIFVKPIGKMSYRNKLQTLPKMLKEIEHIAEKYEGKKGIIHTHTFDIANYIIENSSMQLKNRLLFQRDFSTKDHMIKHHTDRDDTIIIAPAMHEGIDLVGDLSRFQIICKVPYPSMGDKQVKARMSISNKWYTWITAQKIVQSYGRSIRSESDNADTYILDSDFRSFLDRCGKLMPIWFKEAIEYI